MFWALVVVTVVLLLWNRQLKSQMQYVRADTIQELAALSESEEGREALQEYGFQFEDEPDYEDYEDLLVEGE